MLAFTIAITDKIASMALLTFVGIFIIILTIFTIAELRDNALPVFNSVAWIATQTASIIFIIGSAEDVHGSAF